MNDERTETLRRHELSVVACDLRGFTGFLERVAPEQAVELLRSYYALVAEEVVRFEGSIKDHAGDGILVLLGAGAPERDHATRAVWLALAIRDRARLVLAASAPGVGIGVASGPVTVGTIRAGRGLETIAVGPTVNLASRLASAAPGGRVLVCSRAARLVGVAAPHVLHPLEPVRLKGFSHPVTVFAA